MFDPEQIAQLAAALPRELVKDRQGFSYIEGHEAIRACNRIFGFGNWQRNEPAYQRVMDETYPDKHSGKEMYRVGYTCKLSLTIFSADRQNAITTWGTGYGEQVTGENAGKAHEGAIKEAETDAMKRALIALGDQFGLALYDKQQRHVENGAAGNGASSGAVGRSGRTVGQEAESVAPYCAKHRKDMRPSKSSPGNFYCPTKDEYTGKWCEGVAA